MGNGAAGRQLLVHVCEILPGHGGTRLLPWLHTAEEHSEEHL